MLIFTPIPPARPLAYAVHIFICSKKTLNFFLNCSSLVIYKLLLCIFAVLIIKK